MKKRNLMLLVFIGILCLIGAVWYFWPRPLQVDILTVEKAPATRVLSVNGRLRPRLSVNVQASVGGTLIALPFDVGDNVTAGQILARVDDSPEQAAIAEAQASVASQQAVLAQSKRDLARFQALGEFATKREVEQRQLAVREGEQELNRRRANVKQTIELRARREVRAPFSGVILERPIDPGQTIGPDTILYFLADLNQPEVNVQVDEIYAAGLKPRMAAFVTVPGTTGELRAEVVHIEPRVDPSTGARDVRLRLFDQPADLASGLTVTVNLVVDERKAAISIPRSAILSPDNAPLVRVVNGEGVVSDRPIRFIDWPAQQVIVTDGLAKGDRILKAPDAAKSGDRVELRRTR